MYIHRYLEERKKKALLKRKGLNIEEVLEFSSLKGWHSNQTFQNSRYQVRAHTHTHTHTHKHTCPPDEVKFGEVVMAPPQLQAQPRGSKEVQPRKAKTLLLHQKFSQYDPSPAVQTCGQGLPVVGLKRKLQTCGQDLPVVGLKRKQDLEVERERAICLYRQEKKMREKRKHS